MTRFRQIISFSGSGRKAALVLACWWVFGLISGAWIFRQAEPDLPALKQTLCDSSPTFLSLFLCALLPLTAAFTCVYCSMPKALFVLCFAKVFALSYTSCAICSAFGGSGWLIRGLLMFSDLAGTVILYVFCSRCLSGSQKFNPGAIAVYPILLLLIVLTDYHFVSPLLLRLLS